MKKSSCMKLFVLHSLREVNVFLHILVESRFQIRTSKLVRMFMEQFSFTSIRPFIPSFFFLFTLFFLFVLLSLSQFHFFLFSVLFASLRQFVISFSEFSLFYFFLFITEIMVLILDGNSEHVAHLTKYHDLVRGGEQRLDSVLPTKKIRKSFPAHANLN